MAVDAGSSSSASAAAAPTHAADASTLNDPALLLPLLAGLPAESLVRIGCVQKSWAAAERTERGALWRALVLARWPSLCGGPATDWRKRYRVLSRLGVPLKRAEEDKLARFEFVVQGRFAPSGALAFSGVATVTRGSSEQIMGGHIVEFKDSVDLEVKLPTPVRLPPCWRDDEQGHEVFEGIEVSIIAQDREEQQVAHLLGFSVDKHALEYSVEPTSDEDDDDIVAQAVQLWQGPGDACLPSTFEVEVDSAESAGCGPPQWIQTPGVGPRRRRADPPWLEAMLQDVSLGGLMLRGPWIDLCPLRLGFRVVGGQPRLSSMRMHISMYAESVNGTIGIPVALKEVLACDSLEWS